MARAGSPSKSDQVMVAALRLLSRRDRSQPELDRALARRGFNPLQRGEALRRLRQLGYVDDARLARSRTESLLRQGKYGRRGVLLRLEALGLSEEQATQAFETVGREVGFEEAVVAKALLRKSKVALPIRDARTWARAARLLEGRGFAQDTITGLLGEEGPGFSD